LVSPKPNGMIWCRQSVPDTMSGGGCTSSQFLHSLLKAIISSISGIIFLDVCTIQLLFRKVQNAFVAKLVKHCALTTMDNRAEKTDLNVWCKNRSFFDYVQIFRGKFFMFI
jgi:hypothetical protein